MRRLSSAEAMCTSSQVAQHGSSDILHLRVERQPTYRPLELGTGLTAPALLGSLVVEESRRCLHKKIDVKAVCC